MVGIVDRVDMVDNMDMVYKVSMADSIAMVNIQKNIVYLKMLPDNLGWTRLNWKALWTAQT